MHNNGPVKLTLFTLNEPLPTPVSSMQTQVRSEAIARKAQYTFKGVAAHFNVITSNTAGTPVTFDLTAFAKANPELRTYEFEMLASGDMLDLNDAEVSNVADRPSFTITSSEKTPASVLDIPLILTDGYELPQISQEVAISWTSSDPSVLDGHKIVGSNELKQVTLTATSAIDSKDFSVIIFPKDPLTKPTVFAYVDNAQSAQLGYSMHYAVLSADGSVTPLNFGDGVLFAPTDWTQGQNTSVTTEQIQDYDPNLTEYYVGGKRILDNPWVFRMADGKFGVVAEQRAYDDTLPAGYNRTLFFWTTENLIDFEFKGATPQLSTSEAISKPQVEYDNGAYYITWVSGNNVREIRTTDFVTFTDYNANSTRLRASVPNVIGGISCMFSVSTEEYDYLLKKLTPLTNTAADNSAELVINAGDSLTVADPDITYFEGYYYFISTFDASGSGSDSYQESLRIRRAETLAGLANAPESIIISYSSSTRAYKWAPELHIINGKLRILVAIGQGSASWNRQHANIITLKDGGNNDSYEGPEAFQLIGQTGSSGWRLLTDVFGGNNTRFAMYGMTDITGSTDSNVGLSSIGAGSGLGQTNINSFHGAGRARHGAVITIDESRFNEIWKKYFGTDYNNELE